MNMIEAVKAVYSKYAKFSGRSRRAEFWWFFLAYIIVYFILGMIDIALFGQTVTTDTSISGSTDFSPLATIFALASLIPNIALGVRRLHDINKSGWWILINLIPIVGLIVYIVWAATGGDKGPNRFGPDPIDGSDGDDGDYAESSIPRV